MTTRVFMNHIVIHEVGPRNGLQMERQVVPTDTREDWIRRTINTFTSRLLAERRI